MSLAAPTLLSQPVFFMVQTSQSAKGELHHELYIPHLGGESVELVDVSLVEDGCILRISNGESVLDIGNKEDPLPHVLIGQLASPLGMLLVETKENEFPSNFRYHLLSTKT